MKDKLKIIIPVILIIILIGVAVFFLIQNFSGGKSNLKIESSAQLVELVDKLYEGQNEDLMYSLSTTEVDLSDADTLNFITGLKNGDKLEYLAVSEPMITSRAHSLMIGKVKPGVDANSVAKELFDSVNPRKWVCVSAEKVYATSSGDIIFLVMSDEETVKLICENFKSHAGKIGQEYEKYGELEEDIELPDEMMLQ